MRDGFYGGARYAFAVVLLLFGMWAGLQFPDADQKWLWLRHIIMHRSILTHGLLLPLFLFWHYHKSSKANQSDPVPRLALMGLLIGLSAHFAFDLFPNRWWGYALIHVPLYGRLSPLFSETWLGVSLFACLYGGCRLLRNVPDLFITLVVMVVAFVLCAQTESSSSIAPLFALLTLVVMGSIAFVLPRPPVNPTAPTL